MPDPNNNTNSSKSNELLYRLDEKVASTSQILLNLSVKVANIEEKFDKVYVTKSEFVPIQRAVYAAIGIILSGFFAVLGATIFHSGIVK